MNTNLKIRYTPEKQDYLHASRTLAKKSTGFLILAGTLIIAMIASVIVLVFSSIGDPSWRNIAVVVLLVGVFYIVYYLAFIPFQLSRAYKTNDYLRLAREVSFTDEAMVMTTGEKSSKLLWDKFREVIAAEDIYLLVYKGAQTIYLFIPRRSFEAEASQDQFLQILAAKSIEVR